LTGRGRDERIKHMRAAVEAREPLRRGLDLAQRCGATVLGARR